MNRVRWKTWTQGKGSLPWYNTHEQALPEDNASWCGASTQGAGVTWRMARKESPSSMPLNGRKMAGFRTGHTGLKWGEGYQRKLERCTEDQHSSLLAEERNWNKIPSVMKSLWRIHFSRGVWVDRHMCFFYLPELTMCKFHRPSASPDSHSTFLTFQSSGFSLLVVFIENLGHENTLWVPIVVK